MWRVWQVQLLVTAVVLVGFSLSVYFSVQRLSFDVGGGKTYVETTGKVVSYKIFEKYLYCAYSTVLIDHVANTTCEPIDYHVYSCESEWNYPANKIQVDMRLHYSFPIASNITVYYNRDDATDCIPELQGKNYGSGSGFLKGLYYTFLSVLTIAIIALIFAPQLCCTPPATENDPTPYTRT